MSCYLIKVENGHKVARSITSEEEYKQLRGSNEQKANLRLARAGNDAAKRRLVQFNYSGHYPQGVVKGMKLPSGAFGFDMDEPEAVNVIEFIYIYEFHSFVIDYISQFFRDIRLFFVETVSNTSLPVVCLISLVSDTIICAILPNGHSLQMKCGMFLRRILQSLYRCFPIFHINLKARSYPIEFLSCNPPNPLLARQIVRHIVVEPIRICNNNINQPLQIAEKSGKGILIPSVI